MQLTLRKAHTFAGDDGLTVRETYTEMRPRTEQIDAAIDDAVTALHKAEAELLEERRIRRQVELDLYVARAAERAAVAKLDELLRSEKSESDKSETLKEYAASIERKYVEIINSNTWRITKPVRWFFRKIKRQNAPDAFSPRFLYSNIKPRKKPLATILEDKLWGGFSQYALMRLLELRDSSKNPRDRARAAWVLGRWFAAQGDPQRALANVVHMRTLDPAQEADLRCMLLEADCLTRLGMGEQARTRLSHCMQEHPSLFLALSNTYLGEDGRPDEQDAKRLAWINRLYELAGVSPLVKLDPSASLTIGNLRGDAPPTPIEPDQPRISVIMPVYRAAATIPFAVRGLLDQTWRNLEVVIVDDCSGDDTPDIAEALAADDPRIRVLRLARNRGSYVARNAGLKAATGAFVTTHDADDWSHPQKLELQIRHALTHPEAVATFSDWVRCSDDLRFGWLFRASGSLVGKSMPSIMMRRETFDALGAWDEVRVGGDTDLLRRVEKMFGVAAVARVAPGIPLALALHEDRSLTRQSASHVRTMLYGARREYNEAGAYWREHVRKSSELRLSPDPARRTFPAPLTILGRGDERHDFDVLFVSDFCMKGGAFVSTLNYVEACRRAGLSVGLFHWRRYDLGVKDPLNPKIRQLAQEGVARIVAPGERARAAAVIIGYPAILAQKVDLFPEIDCDRLFVVVNQMASRLHGGGDPQYDPLIARATLHDLFGSEGIWVPISGLVQRLMRSDPRYPVPSDAIWTPLIDAKVWCAEPPRWRGGPERRPVVGRHARDHYTKWPSTAAALRGAYCADKPCTVELMGGTRSALKLIGEKPANWTVRNFGAMEADEFLRRLDFFIHYPHEDYIEEFGRAVLEAIAIGVPAILPPVFEQTFGDAAVYAEPADVWTRIESLWMDEACYLDQARRGRAFVAKNSDWSRMSDRLHPMMAKASASA